MRGCECVILVESNTVWGAAVMSIPSMLSDTGASYSAYLPVVGPLYCLVELGKCILHQLCVLRLWGVKYELEEPFSTAAVALDLWLASTRTCQVCNSLERLGSERVVYTHEVVESTVCIPICFGMAQLLFHILHHGESQLLSEL